MRQIACAFERVVTHVAPRFDCSIQEADRVSVTCLELSGRFPTCWSHRHYYEIIITGAIKKKHTHTHKENYIYFYDILFIELFSREIDEIKKGRFI